MAKDPEDPQDPRGLRLPHRKGICGKNVEELTHDGKLEELVSENGTDPKVGRWPEDLSKPF